MKLILGDCLVEMDNIPTGSVDAIIADIPYGTTACKWDTVIPFEPMWKQLNRIIKPNGAIVLFGSEPFSSYLRMSNIKNYKYDWVWDKINGSNFVNAKKQPLRQTENISVFYQTQPNYNPIMVERNIKSIRHTKRKNGKGKNEIYGLNQNVEFNGSKKFGYPKNIIRVNKRSKECHPSKILHPTQKPVALMEYLIKTYTNEGETVLDFTMGSGTTGVACKNLNRDFIGIELDEKYFNIAKDRIEKYVVQTELEF